MSNPNTLDWIYHQDIQVKDAKLKQQFDAYISSGDFKEALKLLLNKKEELKGKAYISEIINKIVTSVAYLEKLYDDNVTLFLSDLASQYFNLVDEFKNAGTWKIGNTYVPYNFVFYEKEIYMAFDNVPVGTLPTDGRYWIKYGLLGEDGAPGINAKVKYQWESGRQYTVNDIVSYKGDLYVAKVPNTDIEPGTDEATWLTFLFVAKGEINVGKEPPKDPVQNTIWFKTLVDPLEATTPISGKMFRYRVSGDWESMYPATFFSLIEDKEKYAVSASVWNLLIKPENWGFLQGKYVMTYNNPDILNNSIVSIMPSSIMTSNASIEYSNLEIEVKTGGVIFSTLFRPTESMKITMKIQ